MPSGCPGGCGWPAGRKGSGRAPCCPRAQRTWPPPPFRPGPRGRRDCRRPLARCAERKACSVSKMRKDATVRPVKARARRTCQESPDGQPAVPVPRLDHGPAPAAWETRRPPVRREPRHIVRMKQFDRQRSVAGIVRQHQSSAQPPLPFRGVRKGRSVARFVEPFWRRRNLARAGSGKALNEVSAGGRLTRSRSISRASGPSMRGGACGTNQSNRRGLVVAWRASRTP